MKVLRTALRTGIHIGPGYDHLTAVFTVPDRDAVSPPELAGDTPVTDVLHPVGIGVFPSLGIESDVPVLPCGKGLVSHTAHRYEPLLGKIGLNHRVTAVAVSHVVGMILDADEVSAGLKVGDDELTGLNGIESAVLFRHVLIECSVRIEEVDGLKAVTPSALPVVGVMGRCDLNHTGTEFLIDEAVCDDGDLLAH